jgi:hypothetical protein
MNAVNTAQIFYVMRSLLPILRYFFNLWNLTSML